MLKYLIPIAVAALSVPQAALAQGSGSTTGARQRLEQARVERAEAKRDFVPASRDARAERHDAERLRASSDAGIDAREARQREAIRRGVESGQLTPREAERLRQEQARIERHEQIARADGRFTAREQARIQRELDRSQQHIRHEMHDRQRVGQHDRGHHYGHYRQIAHRGGWPQHGR